MGRREGWGIGRGWKGDIPTTFNSIIEGFFSSFRFREYYMHWGLGIF